MKILCLYNNPCALPLFDWLKEQGNSVIMKNEPLDEQWCRAESFDFALSYTYRHIISPEVLAALNHEVLNIHNSFLPFNRGADPNLWSIVSDTPRGVTIHFMDESLDKGHILAQTVVPLLECDTLESSYNALDRAAKELFKSIYPYHSFWHEMAKIPVGKGSYHNSKDIAFLKEHIADYSVGVDEAKRLFDSMNVVYGGGIILG